MKKMSNLKLFFIFLVVLSLFVILAMLFPDSGLMRRPTIFILWGLHMISGFVIVFLTYRQKVTGKVKAFLLAAGFSTLGFLAGVVLHNLFYALGTLTREVVILHAILGGLEVIFFLLAAILCPIGLLVGVTGTFILWKQIPAVKNK